MEQSPQRIGLQPGQRLPQYVEAGVQILAVSGSVRIEGPLAALGEHIMRSVVALQEGDTHLVSDTGWICLTAAAKAEVLCIASPSDARPLWRSLLAMLDQLRRRAVSRYEA